MLTKESSVPVWVCEKFVFLLGSVIAKVRHVIPLHARHRQMTFNQATVGYYILNFYVLKNLLYKKNDIHFDYLIFHELSRCNLIILEFWG